MVIVAQLITSTWSKRFRGGTGAAVRNSVPERLALPTLATLPDAPVVSLVHRQAYGEYNMFSAPVWEKLVYHTGVFTPLTPALGLHLPGDEDGRLRIVFESPQPVESERWGFVDLHVGAPARIAPRSPFALKCGEWGRIRYMGRHKQGFEGFTYYEKCVCNVAWLPANKVISLRLFLDIPISHHFDSMPDVW